MLAVVALGGHALLPKGEDPTIARQFENTRLAVHKVLRLVDAGWRLVVTHGNGPQVGHILIRTEAAAGKAYDISLSVAVAESEGEIGYVLQQSIHNEMVERGETRPIVTVLTQVLVDPRDPAFSDPTKPIGPFHSDAEAEALRSRGVHLSHFPGHGWRRVVASPTPLEVLEADTVRRLADMDIMVIAAGGGGIPVYEEEGRLWGVDAVIDKDLASAVLATSIGADSLFILTDVRKVALNFEQPEQEDLDAMSVAEAESHLAAGQFPPGSMGPKVEAAVQFLRSGGKLALITSPEALKGALAGRDGTRITR